MASAILICFWTVASICIALSGLLYMVSPHTPQIFQDILLYGKARGRRKEKTIIQYLEVPKRWFWHFYAVGVLVNSVAFYILYQSFINGQPAPLWFTDLIDFFTTSHQIHITATSAMLLVLLMFLQTFRRLMECWLISVYSKATINLAHYGIGFIIYSTFSIAVMSEAPSLLIHKAVNVLEELPTLSNLAGVALFLWASYQHHVVHEQFANLRRDRTGKVTTYQHKIPRGHWFELVSCPHYFFEILIYTSFLLIGGLQHSTLFSFVVFVLDNQLVAGFISHNWYQSTFPDYPRNRAAVIPFLI